MDVLTTEQRSRCMAAIRCRDTKPELIVRKVVRALGYRFRSHVKSLPGCPDLVLPKAKKIVFIHGCWWHMHACPLGKPVPKTRPEFWVAKLRGNRLRDARQMRELKASGWRIITVWECQTRKKRIDRTIRRLAVFLAD
jgi:DNA mismatch endonuclease (patch repair protein)